MRELGHLVIEWIGGARGSHAIDVDVVHDSEEPGAQVGAAAVQVQLCPGTLQRVLDQVVGGGAITNQRAGITPQPRNQLNQALGFIHRYEQECERRYSTLFALVGQCRQAAQVGDHGVEVLRGELAGGVAHNF